MPQILYGAYYEAVTTDFGGQGKFVKFVKFVAILCFSQSLTKLVHVLFCSFACFCNSCTKDACPLVVIGC